MRGTPRRRRCPPRVAHVAHGVLLQHLRGQLGRVRAKRSKRASPPPADHVDGDAAGRPLSRRRAAQRAQRFLGTVVVRGIGMRIHAVQRAHVDDAPAPPGAHVREGACIDHSARTGRPRRRAEIALRLGLQPVRRPGRYALLTRMSMPRRRRPCADQPSTEWRCVTSVCTKMARAPSSSHSPATRLPSRC